MGVRIFGCFLLEVALLSIFLSHATSTAPSTNKDIIGSLASPFGAVLRNKVANPKHGLEEPIPFFMILMGTGTTLSNQLK